MFESMTISDDLRRYAAILIHWAWLIILMACLAGLVAYIFAKRSTPVYSASTMVMVNTAPATNVNDYNNYYSSMYLAQTYAQTMATWPVLQAVAEKMGLPGITASVRVDVVENTQLLKIIVEDTDPQRAADIANNLVAVFSEQTQADQASRYAESKQNLQDQMLTIEQNIQDRTNTMEELGNGVDDQNKRSQLETLLSQDRQTYASLLQSYEQIRLAEIASTSTLIQKVPAAALNYPIRPQVMRMVLMGAVVGMMLGVGLVFLIAVLDDTLKGPEEITHLLKIPVLGVILRHDLSDDKPVTIAQSRSPVSEAFRALRTNIQFISVDRPLRTLLVTSASPEEGKTTIAANLAVVLAQSGKKVLLIDADMRRPMVHKMFVRPNRKGLSDLFVSSDLSLEDYIRPGDMENLFLITSGNKPPNPSELLGSERMHAILEQVKENYDLIIIDSPPMMAVTDAAVLSSLVDGVLLVAKPGKTKLAAYIQSYEQLSHAGAPMVGAVLNDVELKHSRYSSYYYYKGYYRTYYTHYGYEQKEETQPQNQILGNSKRAWLKLRKSILDIFS